MNKKRSVLLPLCLSAVMVLYLLVSARPLGTELHFIPRWTADVSRPVMAHDQTPDAVEGAIPFKLAQMLGYITEDGTVLRNTTFDYKATISARHYAPYGTHTEPLPFYNSDGTTAGTIDGTGFPYFTEDAEYLFLPGGASFARVGDGGALLWRYEAYAPITAFATAAAGCVAGLADGTIIVFDNDGAIEQQFAPGGSDYPVILGVALSAAGDLVACVCGQERQRFVLAKTQNGHTEIIYHQYLDHAVTRQVPVQFSRDARSVYFASASGLGIVHTESYKHAHLALTGNILSLKEDDAGNLYILSRNGSDCTVSIMQPFATYVGAFSFRAQSVCIAVKGNSLFVGRDGSISRIDIVEQ